MNDEELRKKMDEPNPFAVYVNEFGYDLIKKRENYALKAFQKVGINPDVIIEQDALITQLKAQLRAVINLCTEETDHHLVDKDWILRAIIRESK